MFLKKNIKLKELRKIKKRKRARARVCVYVC